MTIMNRNGAISSPCNTPVVIANGSDGSENIVNRTHPPEKINGCITKQYSFRKKK